MLSEADLDSHLALRAEALRKGDSDQAQLALDLLEETRRGLEVRNVVTASTMLIQEARAALEVENPKEAVRLAEAAGRLSPELPAAHWVRLVAYLEDGESSAGRVVAAARDYVLAWVRGFRNQAHLSVQLTLLVLIALVAAASGFTALQILKYATFAAHDLASFGPRFVGAGEVLIVLLALGILPVIVLASLPIGIGIALAVLMVYQSVGERAVSVAWLVLLAAAPWLLRAVAPMATLDGSSVDVIASAVSEASTGGVEDHLRREMDRSRDFVSAVVLAHRLRRRGDLEGAEQAYRKALDVRPRDPDAQNNLGVVQYLLGRRDGARTAFRAAQAGGRAEPVLNLAVMSAEDGRFDEANQLLEQARGIDATLVERHQTLDEGLSAEQKLTEARLDDGLLWSALFEQAAPRRTSVARELARPILGWAGGIGFTATLWALAITGLVVARRHAQVSVGCPKCGLPARQDASRQLCDQCRSVFLSAAAVDPKLRQKKEGQVRRYQRWRRWSVRTIALLAGGGDIFAGRAFTGAVLLFAFCLAVIVALTPSGWGAHAWHVHVGDSFQQARLVLGLGVAALLSLLSLGRTLAR